MSVGYVPVQWNRKKIVYDAFVFSLVLIYTQLFVLIARKTLTGSERISEPILQMRAFGSCAFLMLTLILCIGPLARLRPRFLPILYNRRHLGVVTFIVACWHAVQVTGFYQNYGRFSQLQALVRYDSTFTGSSVPFQFFGAGALLIFAVMAFTSHDFWQKALGPTAWKSIHMGIYAAYALILAHVFFGELQWETHPAYVAFFSLSGALVVGLHLLAAFRSTKVDDDAPIWIEYQGRRWLSAGSPDSIPHGRAKPLAVPGGERLAIIRYSGGVAALHGVWAHQGGPLYEGKVIDGCLTCPWHGWQYRPDDGCSPPPFTEKLPTYEVALKDGQVLVDPSPLPPGTPPQPIAWPPNGGLAVAITKPTTGATDDE